MLWIAIPAGQKDFPEKKEWVNLPICQKLKDEKGVEFGFQMVGKPFDGLEKIVKNHPVGLHLPAGIADHWGEENRGELLVQLSSLNLKFVVIHGKKIGEPFPEYLPLSNDDSSRHISQASAAEYLEALDEMEVILNELRVANIPIALETLAFNNFDYKNDIWRATTHLDLRVGDYTTDLLEMQRRTECSIVNDIQHLSFSLNFAHRMYNYSFLQKKVRAKIPDDFSSEEKMVFEKYRIFLRKGEVPSIKAGTLKEEVDSINAKIYHLSGCYDSNQVEIMDNRVASHAGIRKDKCFRTLLRMVLSQNPEVLVIEVSGNDDNPCWNYRPPTLKLQKKSLKNLCKLLLEEL